METTLVFLNTYIYCENKKKHGETVPQNNKTLNTCVNRQDIFIVF